MITLNWSNFVADIGSGESVAVQYLNLATELHGVEK